MEKKRRPRSEEEIMDAIIARAASYVPEWRPDRSDPDIGTALAQVFARLQSGTEQKYDRLPEKFRTDLFNCLNTSMRASSPARGYAVFGIADAENGGTEVPAGTPLLSDVEDEAGERIPVETEEDVYVSADTLTAIYECFDGDDYIGCWFDGEERKEIPLFGRRADNLQEHVFCMGHPFLLSLKSYGRIRLSFYERAGVAVDQDILEALACPEKAVFFYIHEDREISFAHVTVEADGLVLEKTADMPPWEPERKGEAEGCWLYCRILDKAAFARFSFEEVYLVSECPGAEPELVYADGAEKRGGAFFAFGERPAVYGELYFASAEVFGKKGAEVELSFEQEFARVPINAPVEPDPVKWRLVMPKGDVRQEKEYEITIEEVVWEYYNGRGWAALPVDISCSRMFHSDEGRYRQLKRVEFTCPMDIEPVLVEAAESYYIRARIVKLNNAFKTTGFYMAPVISGAALRCRYPANVFRPSWFFTRNNLEERLSRAADCMGPMRPFAPVQGTGDREGALYLGFTRPPERGPVRLLFVMEHDFERRLPELSWEYRRGGRWRELHPADETEGLSRTGLLTFSGLADAEPSTVGGRELFWLRVRDKTGAYREKREKLPVIRQIWMNATRIITVRHGLEERFTMDGYRSHASFGLLYRNIHRLEVWVRENRLSGTKEAEELLAAGRLVYERDGDGSVRETWVRWEETDSFLYHGPGDRCYVLDANEGRLTFGGGLHGAIPAPVVPDGIRVRYSIGGGEACNLLPGQVTGLEASVGFINRVTNPLALSGGCGRETAREAMERAGLERRHQFRAVSAEDYAALAREATGNIEKAACFSGLSGEGERRPGAVTLVILKKDYQTGGPFFGDMKREIREYLRKKLPVGLSPRGGLSVREPLLVELELMVTAEVAEYSDMFRVRREMDRALTEFLDPVAGNFDSGGWAIGTLPDRLQLETVIKGTEGLGTLKSFVAFAFLRNEPGRPEVELEEIRKHPYVLPVSGHHTIRIQVSGG